MTNKERIDRMITRLCFVRNALTKHVETDFSLDLHPTEAEVTTLFESLSSQLQDITNEQRSS